MFKFNPYNFTITIDEAIQPAGIPTDTTQVFDPKYKPIPYAGPLAGKPGYRENLLGPGVFKPNAKPLIGAKRSTRIAFTNDAGKRETQSFSGLAAVQQAPIQQNVRANLAASQQASPPLTPGVMTPIQKQVMLAKNLAKRAGQNKGTGANPGTPPVYPPPPLPPPPPPAPPAPPPPVTTSTGISARRQKADTFVGGLASAASSIGGSTNRRPDRFGDPGRLIQGLYDAGKAAYDYMKTPGTPGSAATATSPAVAPTPGRFDLRGGGRIPRAGVAGAFGLIAGGPVGGVVGAALGALTGKGQPRKPIPEERYYRVYKMISQHDHR